MTSVKIPYIQDKYKPITLEMYRGTRLAIEQDENTIIIDDIFEFMGKLNYLINSHQFRTLKAHMKAEREVEL